MSRILLVDDDEEFLMLLGEHLSLRFLKFDLATSVEQAKRFMRSTRYRMIVSDLNMPMESGFDLFRHVSARHPDIPFVLMTGCDDASTRREAARLGISACVRKPIYLNELVETIENLLLFAPGGHAPAALTVNPQIGLN